MPLIYNHTDCANTENSTSLPTFLPPGVIFYDTLRIEGRVFNSILLTKVVIKNNGRKEGREGEECFTKYSTKPTSWLRFVLSQLQ